MTKPILYQVVGHDETEGEDRAFYTFTNPAEAAAFMDAVAQMSCAHNMMWTLNYHTLWPDAQSAVGNVREMFAEIDAADGSVTKTNVFRHAGFVGA